MSGVAGRGMGAGGGAGAGGSAGTMSVAGRGPGPGAAGGGAAGSGSAGSSGGQGSDGCSDTLAAGLSLSEVAVFQAVKIPIMKNMAAVAEAQRNADVIQERDAVFRIHVSPQMGWTPRPVSARVELTDAAGTASKRFFAMLTPMRASVDDDAESAFRVRVPAEAMTADARYAVSLVECAADAPAGPATAARFPTEGFTPLEARLTGPVRVHLIPIVAGGRMPEMSQAALDTYKKRLHAMYPVTSVEFTIGEPLMSSASSMCSHLTAIRSRRTADRAAIDVYYYGMTSGLSGGQAGCSTATRSANTTAKTSAGWASGSGSQGGVEGGAATVTHELGHAHGRLHAPCQVQDPDRSYPYRNGDIGVWAYDSRTDKYLPPTRKDMMGYCPNPDRSGAWLSDYTYQALVERVAAVNALTRQALLLPPTEPATPLPPPNTWQLLVVDSAGKHWGEYPLVMHETPEGEPITALIRGRDGSVESVEVYREALEDGVSHGAFMLTVPQRQAHWRSIEVPGLLAPLNF